VPRRLIRLAPRVALCLAGLIAVALAPSFAGSPSKAEPLPSWQSALHDTRDPGVKTGLTLSTIVVGDSDDNAPEKGAYRVGPLVVMRPWTRPAPGGARLTAGYLRITNTGSEPDRLIGGSAMIAGELEIHASEVNEGVARMKALREGLEIPAGATIELRPGGKHLMFAHLRNSVTQGERFEATLVFEKAGPLVVEFDVRNHAGGGDSEPEH